jgi:hypothetical protein
MNYRDCFLGFFLGMDLNPPTAIAAASKRSTEIEDGHNTTLQTANQHDNLQQLTTQCNQIRSSHTRYEMYRTIYNLSCVADFTLTALPNDD